MVLLPGSSDRGTAYGGINAELEVEGWDVEMRFIRSTFVSPCRSIEDASCAESLEVFQSKPGVSDKSVSRQSISTHMIENSETATKISIDRRNENKRKQKLR